MLRGMLPTIMANGGGLFMTGKKGDKPTEQYELVGGVLGLIKGVKLLY
ncbi:hypothetical protein PSAR109036_00555 [Psychrobacter arenosus]